VVELSADLAVRRSELSPAFVVTGEAWAYAKALAAAQATPKAYRGDPASVFLIMQAAVAIDVPVFAALSGINVVEGKAEAGAELMLALLHRAGHRVRHGGDRTAAWCEITRADDPDYTYRETFDLDDAEQAGLCKIRDRDRGLVTARSRTGTALPWESHTRTMLRWRAISQAASYAAPETLMGVKYTPGEVGGEIRLGDLDAADVAFADDVPDGSHEPADEPTTVTVTDEPTEAPAAADDDLSASTAAVEQLDDDADADFERQWWDLLMTARDGTSLTNDLVTLAELGQTAEKLGRLDLRDAARTAWVERTDRAKRESSR